MKNMILFILILMIAIFSLFYIVLTNPVNTSYDPDSKEKIPVDTTLLYQHVEKLITTSNYRNHENIEALNEAADYIITAFKETGLTPYEQTYMANGRNYKNIIAGYGPSDAPVLVVGAHYDVCGNQDGADDNASGVAGLLELARLLNTFKPTLPYRIELVAYTLEEPPYFRTSLMGSAVHAQKLTESQTTVLGMICLEMIGYYSDQKSSQDFPISFLKLFYPSTGNFITVVGKLGEGKMVKKVKRKMIEGADIPVESITAPASIPGIDFSDHQNYWKYNIPAVMITNTAFYRNKNYHMPTDTIDTLNFTKMAEVVKGVYKAITEFQF
ncbi:MAG TPA: M28 family peptidase [Cytophagaceae bacterium]